jgi:hypothetical protein
MSVVTITTDEDEDIDLLELQGEIEGIELFDGRFNRELVQLEFENFILAGRKVEREFCIVEKRMVEGKLELRIIKKVRHVFLFDRPPKYKRAIASAKKQ